MGINAFSLLLLLILKVFWGYSEPPSAYVIDTVRIQGLKKTEPSHLKRYIQSDELRVLDTTQLIKDVQRLRNINSINNARYNIRIKPNHKAVITFICEETLTLLPIVDLGGSSNNIWFMIGGKDINFSGKGEEISVWYQYYGRHSFFAGYRKPYFGTSNIGASLFIKKWATNEPLYFNDKGVNYYYNNYSGGISGIYEFSQKNYLVWGGSLFKETYEKIRQQKDLPGPAKSIKQKLSLKMQYKNNNVDYFYYLQQGWSYHLNYQYVNTLNTAYYFHQFHINIAGFERFNESCNLAGRIRLGLSTNRDTPFAPFVLDDYVNIRGVGNRIARGTGTAYINMEFRYTLFEKKIGAIQGVVFTDLGSWRKPGGHLNDFIAPEIYQLYSGPGLRFIYKKAYNAIFRVDYGFNIKNGSKGGLVFGVGQYF